MDHAMRRKLRMTYGNSSLKAPDKQQVKIRDEHWQGKIVCNHHNKQKGKTTYACKCECQRLKTKIMERGFKSLKESIVP